VKDSKYGTMCPLLPCITHALGYSQGGYWFFAWATKVVAIPLRRMDADLAFGSLVITMPSHLHQNKVNQKIIDKKIIFFDKKKK